MDNGFTGMNADECDDGPYLSDKSVAGLILMSNSRECVWTMVSVG
jgi:hypothetical protein